MPGGSLSRSSARNLAKTVIVWYTGGTAVSYTHLSYPYRLLAPALLISIIILSFNLLGDGLRDAFDPKMKE